MGRTKSAQLAPHTNNDACRTSIPRTGHRPEVPCVSAPATADQDTSLNWVRTVVENDGPGILRTLWRLLGSEQDAMDAYQDCFCRLAALGPHQAPAQARAYAYRAAINAAADVVRGRAHRAAHLPELGRRAAQAAGATASREAGDPSCDALAALPQAIAQLPSHLRNVVVLRDLSRLPYDEVGRMLGIAPATARVYRRHAVVKLAEMLVPETHA